MLARAPSVSSSLFRRFMIESACTRRPPVAGVGPAAGMRLQHQGAGEVRQDAGKRLNIAGLRPVALTVSWCRPVPILTCRERSTLGRETGGHGRIRSELRRFRRQQEERGDCHEQPREHQPAGEFRIAALCPSVSAFTTGPSTSPKSTKTGYTSAGRPSFRHRSGTAMKRSIRQMMASMSFITRQIGLQDEAERVKSGGKAGKEQKSRT